MKFHYPIGIEVAAPLGMFADPLNGSELMSYPLPPASACQGIIESIARVKDVNVEVIAVATCNTPRWTDFTYNSFVPNRKQKLLKDSNALQIRQAVLFEPRFQILAVLSNKETGKKINNAHSMQCQFFRRLRRSQCFHPVSLGHKEFLATYYGETTSKIDQSYSSIIPAMVVEILQNSTIKRRILNDLKIEKGILRFTDKLDVELVDGMLNFSEPHLREQLLMQGKSK